ncbi:uncharacterized protein [Odocoileus virginianus]|uniref:Calponin-homology (CH) domain-containing protein n=1 Tax=Odocoileus virginianus TaxID=9874 RepID=A0ABM4IDN0_ODOVR
MLNTARPRPPAPPPLPPGALHGLYAWLDALPLSRRKRHLARDFSDGVMLAEVVKLFRPRIVDLHNYVPTCNTGQKRSNWTVLNRQGSKRGFPPCLPCWAHSSHPKAVSPLGLWSQGCTRCLCRKVFHKLGLSVSEEEIRKVVVNTPGAVEPILCAVRDKVEAGEDPPGTAGHKRSGPGRAASSREPVPLPVCDGETPAGLRTRIGSAPPGSLRAQRWSPLQEAGRSSGDAGGWGSPPLHGLGVSRPPPNPHPVWGPAPSRPPCPPLGRHPAGEARLAQGAPLPSPPQGALPTGHVKWPSFRFRGGFSERGSRSEVWRASPADQLRPAGPPALKAGADASHGLTGLRSPLARSGVETHWSQRAPEKMGHYACRGCPAGEPWHHLDPGLPQRLLEEKEQALAVLQETIKVLQMKVARLEHLVKLKDQQIGALMRQGDQPRGGGTPGPEGPPPLSTRLQPRAHMEIP